MKKLILSLTLIGTLAIAPTISCMAKVDSPNDKVRFKHTSAAEISEASMFVENTITPKCKCNDKECKEKKTKEKEKDKKCKDKKEVCPSKTKEAEKIEKEKDNKKSNKDEKEKSPEENNEDKKNKKEN